MKHTAENGIKNKRRSIVVKSALVLVFVTGAALALYPFVSNWLSRLNHSRVIQSYNVTVDQLENREIESEINRAIEYNDALSGKSITDPFIPDSGYVVPKDYTSILNIDGVIGYIEIPAINAYLPIYHGVGEAALQKGIGHFNETAFPVGGEGNHAVLTGHRGLPSSELFSKLVNLNIDDVFYIHVLDRILAYAVVSTATIEPGDTNHLRPISGKDYVTLITCTPYSINSHRFIVRGERVEYIPAMSEKENEADGVAVIKWITYILGAITAFVAVEAVRKARRRYVCKANGVQQIKGSKITRPK